MSQPNNKPLSQENKAKFAAYKEANKGWSHLQLVLGESNVKDSHIEKCKETCIENKDEEGWRLCYILSSMSKSQRIKLAKELL